MRTVRELNATLYLEGGQHYGDLQDGECRPGIRW